MQKRGKFVTVSEELRELNLTDVEVNCILKENAKIILFHQEIAEHLGQNVAQLLSQVEYLWKSMGSKPFYKYMNKCESSRKGDSMVEKLSISYSTLRRLLKIVGTRVRNTTKAKELAKTGQEIETLIVYSKKYDGNVYWYFNEKLYNKLRAGCKANFQHGRMAIRSTWKDGHTFNLEGSISRDNTKIREELRKEEKEIYKEKEETMDDPYFGKEEIKTKKQIEKEAKKRATVIAKASKSSYCPPEAIVENNRKGHSMPLDFSVSSSIMALAVEKYGDEAWVSEQATNFINHYTNVNTKRKVVDWSKLFIDKWIKDAYGYKLENEKKNGLTENASTARVQRLTELATQSAVSRAGTTDLAELARRIRDRR